MPSINNFLSGFSNGLPGMKDYQHASRLFIDNRHRLQPKNKWLFHVVININPSVTDLQKNQQLELNMLVKSCQLPKYDMNVEQKKQYNKKVNIMTGVTYSPVDITFYDDNVDTVNAFWKQYLQYHIIDSASVLKNGGVIKRDTYYNNGDNMTHQYGMDGPKQKDLPFINSIEIFALNRKQFTSFTLVNPTIGSWAHDDLDVADGNAVMYNTMQIFYETVLYGAGNIQYSPDNTLGSRGPQGFATIHYDLSPSPLSVLGGGTTSIFGPGGLVAGVGSILGDIGSGNVNLGTIIKGINTYNNSKKIKAKDAVKEELKGIAKQEILKGANGAGQITNPVGNFNVGGALAVVATGAAVAKNSIDDPTNKNKIVNTVIDTENFLSPSESFNVVSNNSTIKDEIAAGIYYKQIGSRQGQSVAESDIAYAALTEQQKNVYRSRVLTDINKLVTEGFIKIDRATTDVTVIAERANI